MCKKHQVFTVPSEKWTLGKELSVVGLMSENLSTGGLGTAPRQLETSNLSDAAGPAASKGGTKLDWKWKIPRGGGEKGGVEQTYQGVRKPLPPSECKEKGGAPFSPEIRRALEKLKSECQSWWSAGFSKPAGLWGRCEAPPRAALPLPADREINYSIPTPIPPPKSRDAMSGASLPRGAAVHTGFLRRTGRCLHRRTESFYNEPRRAELGCGAALHRPGTRAQKRVTRIT